MFSFSSFSFFCQPLKHLPYILKFDAKALEVGLYVDLGAGAGAEAAKAEPKNIRAEASRISVEPKLQNV